MCSRAVLHVYIMLMCARYEAELYYMSACVLMCTRCVAELYFRLEKLRSWSGQQQQSLAGFEKIRTVGKGLSLSVDPPLSLLFPFVISAFNKEAFTRMMTVPNRCNRGLYLDEGNRAVSLSLCLSLSCSLSLSLSRSVSLSLTHTSV